MGLQDSLDKLYQQDRQQEDRQADAQRLVPFLARMAADYLYQGICRAAAKQLHDGVPAQGSIVTELAWISSQAVPWEQAGVRPRKNQQGRTFYPPVSTLPIPGWFLGTDHDHSPETYIRLVDTRVQSGKAGLFAVKEFHLCQVRPEFRLILAQLEDLARPDGITIGATVKYVDNRSGVRTRKDGTREFFTQPRLLREYTGEQIYQTQQAKTIRRQVDSRMVLDSALFLSIHYRHTGAVPTPPPAPPSTAAPPAARKYKLSIHDPCPCGSGKKFGKCCKGTGRFD